MNQSVFDHQSETFTEELYLTLKTNFGYDRFRSHQEAVIRRTLAGGSSLVIMPTGAGKCGFHVLLTKNRRRNDKTGTLTYMR